MSFIKTPVKGMNDFLPSDVRLREHVLSLIRKTYASYGFMEIETPVMEHIENLTGKQGGENEKLIFKVMKRGAELDRAIERGEDYADSGLRYDLTVPLSRYYAANGDKLPSPFKSLQIGNVFRADRPQKGRFRQFVQCDIDILGDASPVAEIDLIGATTGMLSKIFAEVGISRFTVHLNDRRILKAMIRYAGFPEDACDTVFIILDKMDKIGLDGVREELLAAGYAEDAVNAYVSLLGKASEGRDAFCAALTGAGCLDESVASSLSTIENCVRPLINEDVSLVFDPTLVRGMGYYTGTIFEITIDDYNFSIAGGGRYDEMIGKFSGQNVPACGFSIGFERIITILTDKPPMGMSFAGDKAAYLVENGVDGERLSAVFAEADAKRKDGRSVTVLPLKKNAKFQIERLEAEGYNEIIKIYKNA